MYRHIEPSLTEESGNVFVLRSSLGIDLRLRGDKEGQWLQQLSNLLCGKFHFCLVVIFCVMDIASAHDTFQQMSKIDAVKW
jgi:hypothetical protein